MLDGQHQAYLAQELINRNHGSERPLGVCGSLHGVLLANPDKAGEAERPGAVTTSPHFPQKAGESPKRRTA